MKAVLMLEDGKSFYGESLDNVADVIGEVYINTAVVGYQEMITDPANTNKILCLTYPLIGNYGVAPKFNQSNKVWLSGCIIKEKSKIYSNWQAKSSLDEFIRKHKLPTLFGVDTRSIAVHLRNKGEQLGIISTSSFEAKVLLTKISSYRNLPKNSLLPQISIDKIKHFGKAQRAKSKIAILDLGVTYSIIRQLEALGLSITLLPFNTSYKEMRNIKVNGLIISNGPEQDPGLKIVADNIKPLINKLPILGISTGAQVLAAALGVKITKLKIGHHGVNYPMHNPRSFKGEITVQNHSYVVDADSLSKIKNIAITGFNLNDRTVEEFESKKLKLLGVQYIPASPGFNEVNSVLRRFIKML